MAQEGNRQRWVAGCAVRYDAKIGHLLGDKLRLAQGRDETERPAPVHHEHRRAGHSFHPCPVKTSQCAAGDHYAWLAWIDHRAVEDHRPTYGSYRLRRNA